MASKFQTHKGNAWKTKAARGAMNVGMVQPMSLAVEDSNIANLGSALEKKVKLESAKNEEQWSDAGKSAGIQIWRIEQFNVVDWPKENYGTFFSGDSYIILQTYTKPNNPAKMWYNVFFWLGKNTSQDEAGTAAYKTVELDNTLAGLAVQFRETQGFESKRFLSNFERFSTLEGGVESGFNHVKPVEYATRLLQCKGVAPVVCRQINMKRANLNSGDVFILDAGLKMYQFNGKESRPAERAEAAKITRAYDDERGGKVEVIVGEEGDGDRSMVPFWQLLGGEGEIQTKEEGGLDSRTRDVRELYRVTDDGGSMTFTEVAKGAECTLPKFKQQPNYGNDVWVLDTGFEMIVWIGTGANKAEQAKGLKYAQALAEEKNVPAHYPIARCLQGGDNEVFEAALRTFA